MKGIFIMANSNLANIAVFESLQNQTNQSIGFSSSMSVFNNAQELVKMSKKLNDVNNDYIATKKKLETLGETGYNIVIAYNRAYDKQMRYIKELEEKIAKGGNNAQEEAKKLQSEKSIMSNIHDMDNYYAFSTR
jgi:2-methylisocitrate lyase-like PEP mutase family enzyme